MEKGSVKGKRGEGVDRRVVGIEGIEIGKLRGHGDNPNRMSEGDFRKLKGHIERTGRYEPIVVRKFGGDGEYQIINGHHRCRALGELGYKRVDCIVWDVDDKETDILLMTLNRLGGRDVIEKKMEILQRLESRSSLKELTKWLPGSVRHLEAMAKFKLPTRVVERRVENFATAMVFFLNKEQRAIVEQALAASDCHGEGKANDRAKGLVKISEKYLTAMKNE